MTNQEERGTAFSALNNKITPSTPFTKGSVNSVLLDVVGRRARTAKEESSIAQETATKIEKGIDHNETPLIKYG